MNEETSEVRPATQVSRRRALAIIGGGLMGFAGTLHLKTGETHTMGGRELRREILANRMEQDALRTSNNGFIEYFSETLPPSNTRTEVSVNGKNYALDNYRISYGTTYFDQQKGFVDSVKPVVVETQVPRKDHFSWKNFRNRCFGQYSEMPKTELFDQSFLSSFYFKSEDDEWIIVSYNLSLGTRLDRGLSAPVTDLKNLTLQERFQISEAHASDVQTARQGSIPIIRETYQTLSDGSTQVEQSYNERHANASHDYAPFIAAAMPHVAQRRRELLHDFADAPHTISAIKDTHDEAHG